MSGKNFAEILKSFRHFIKTSEGFYTNFKTINIIEVGDGTCCAELKILPEHCNRMGNMHGGCTATLIDDITTFGLIAKEGLPGVTVNLNVNYLKGAKVGEEVVIESRTIRSGRSLAYLEGILKSKADNSVLAHGTHVKFIKR